ncbi:MAG: DegQ family serine endoprotease [Desulfatiglans sp.]|jgi:serine protease Do|nr:DegQ family serine endoprotease [Desulfatiglans sp.]
MKNRYITQYISTCLKRSVIASGIAILFTIFILPVGTSVSAKPAPDSFSGLVKEASPSVVYISTKKTIKQRFLSPFGQNDPLREFFEKFYGDRFPRDRPQSGLGTGFIIDKEGYILTNNHVVEMADEIKVTLEDKSEFEAKIVGRDPETDIALIRIEGAKNLKALKLGDSDLMDVGDWVVAIGNPYGLGNTVTAGIVSAKHRNNVGIGTFDNFLQTDASINPGNSGGPLININGDVIGINSAIYSQTGGSVGIGFAIPINMAKDLLPMLKTGKIVRGYLGVGVQDITPDLKEQFKLESENGALITQIYPDGPSEKAGLKRDDVIISFMGKEIKDSKRLPYLVSATPVGTEAEVVVIRKGERKTFSVKLGERPPSDEEGVVKESSSMNLGMSIEALTEEKARRYGIADSEGILVLDVEYNSPAAEAGLRQGDIILEVDRIKIKTENDFEAKLKSYRPGDKLLLLVKRGKSQIYTTLRVSKDKQ